jgi:hypothetical protein
MLGSFIFLVWFVVNIVFLSNFSLAGGYLAIVNFAFMAAALILPQQNSYGKD